MHLPVEPDISPPNALRSPILRDNTTDAELVHMWLVRKVNENLRPNTVNQYALEGQRLLWFANAVGRRFQAWSVEDANAYLLMLRAPPPHAVGRTRTRASAAWRPLKGPLSEDSYRQSQIIAGAFFKWLIEAAAIRANPFGKAPRQRKDRGPGTQRSFLELSHLRAVFEAIEARPKADFWDRIKAARDRMVIALLFQTGLRTSEAISLTWQDFERREGKHGPYWVIILRQAKGGSQQSVPCDSAMAELAQFRAQLGLSPEPRRTDRTAVIPALPGGWRSRSAKLDGLTAQRSLERPVRTRQALGGIVRAVFKEAAKRAEARGQADLVAKLEEATAHWLRHTAATHLLRATGSITDVQSVLRHKDINTTRTYAHDDEEAVAAAVAGKLKLPG